MNMSLRSHCLVVIEVACWVLGSIPTFQLIKNSFIIIKDKIMQKNTEISNALYERTQAERNNLMFAAGLHNLSVEQKYLWPSLNNYFIFDPSVFFIQYPSFEVMGIYIRKDF